MKRTLWRFGWRVLATMAIVGWTGFMLEFLFGQMDRASDLAFWAGLFGTALVVLMGGSLLTFTWERIHK